MDEDEDEDDDEVEAEEEEGRREGRKDGEGIIKTRTHFSGGCGGTSTEHLEESSTRSADWGNELPTSLP